MSGIVILNVVLAISVVVGIVSLLRWAIAADSEAVTRRSRRHHTRVYNKPAFPTTGPEPALDLSAE